MEKSWSGSRHSTEPDGQRSEWVMSYREVSVAKHQAPNVDAALALSHLSLLLTTKKGRRCSARNSDRQLISMLVVGPWRAHIEDLPWYVIVTLAYFLVVALSIVLEQFPRLLMHPAAHNFQPGQPKCRIFKTCSLSQDGSAINVTFGIEAMHQISLIQSWRSVRVRVRGRLATEVLRSDGEHVMINRTHVSITYQPAVLGTVDIDVFCSDDLLATYHLFIPSDTAPPYSTIFDDNRVYRACLSNDTLIIYGETLMHPAQIGHFNITLERAGFNNATNATFTLINVPDYYNYVDVTALLSSRLHLLAHPESSALVSGAPIPGTPSLMSPTCAQHIDLVNRSSRALTRTNVSLLRRSIPLQPLNSLLSVSVANCTIESLHTISLEDTPFPTVMTKLSESTTIILPCTAPAPLLAMIPSSANIYLGVLPNSTHCPLLYLAENATQITLTPTETPNHYRYASEKVQPPPDECPGKANCR